MTTKRFKKYLLASFLCAGTGLIAPAGGQPAPDSESVRDSLTLKGSGMGMDPVTAPARVARVAAVQGSPIGEAWAYGFSFARTAGFDQTTVFGQPVFLRYTNSTGWQVTQPTLDSTGRPLREELNGIAVAPSGEGWAVGVQGAVYHRRPGGPWLRDDQASSIARGDLMGVSLGQDERGVFGYAVGAGLTLLKLDENGWRLDAMNGVLPESGGRSLPELFSVAAVDRERAWAVGSGNAQDPTSRQSNSGLLVMKRRSGGWTRQLTNSPMFDSPPAPITSGGSSTTVNQFAIANGVAATADGAWVTGNMQPVDATKPFGEPGSDRSRPFAIHFDNEDHWTSYCPRLYQLSGSGLSSTVDVCDKPFPFSTGELPVIASFEDGSAIAGGSGLYRFSGGVWERAPNTAGFLVSGSFASPREGWMATPGNTFSRSGTAASSSTILGHWTSTKPGARMVRWPHPDTRPLESIALAPSGASALAVGADGAAVRLDPEGGWDVTPTPTSRDLHGLAWPAAPGPAWAVGERGVILRYSNERWVADEASEKLSSESLFGLAFQNDSRGWAVGNRGTILRFDAGRWSADPASNKLTERKLSAVAFVGSTAIAVGDRGTILMNEGAGWRLVDDQKLQEILKAGQDRAPSNLLSVTGVPDGTAFIGGEKSVLLEMKPGGDLRPSTLPPLEGSIHTLRAWRSPNGETRLLASVGSSASRFSSAALAEASGAAMYWDGGRWTEISASRPAASSSDFDAPVQRDAVYAFEVDTKGSRAWAVGGFPEGMTSEQGHLRQTSTGSIWNVGLQTKPAYPAGQSRTTIATVPGSVNFAFLAETSCAAGICGVMEGSGIRGDAIATSALREIDEAARRGSVSFVVFGGDMRRNGLPDELMQFKKLLGELSVPVYGSMGDRDLFAGLGPTFGSQQGGLVPSSGYYLRAFQDAPGPWGHSAPPAGFLPFDLPGSPARDERFAASHYAVDFAPNGRRLLRMIFLDTSSSPLAATAQRQNPPRDQLSWLQAALQDSQQLAAIPSIVVMHQPLVVPIASGAEAALVTGALATGGASAVLSSHLGVNRIVRSPSDGAPDSFPVGSFSGGGSPLGAQSLPEAGAYHAWQLVSVNVASQRTQLGRAPVTIRSMPILESVALNAPEGRRQSAGATLRFKGVGRLPDVGGAHYLSVASDLAQSRATYLRFPLPSTCGLFQSPEEGCYESAAASPDHALSCDDLSVCVFVKEDPNSPGQPLRDAQGRLRADPSSGLMCAVRAGKTNVILRVGTALARMPVTITGGSGICATASIVFSEDPLDPGAAPAQSESAPAAAEKDHPRPPKSRVPEPIGVAAVAPPIVNAAPAPPGGGAAQREEEKEAATEQAEMTALPVAARRSPLSDPSPLTQSTAMFLALGAFGFTAAKTFRHFESRCKPVQCRIHSHVAEINQPRRQR